MLKSQDTGATNASAADSFHNFGVNGANPASARTSASTASGSAKNARAHPGTDRSSGAGAGAAVHDFSIPDAGINIGADRDMDRWQFNDESPTRPGSLDDFNFAGRMPGSMSGIENNASWELIQLNLEEPLPDQGIIDELCVLLCRPFATSFATSRILALTLHSTGNKSTLKRSTPHCP